MLAVLLHRRVSLLDDQDYRTYLAAWRLFLWKYDLFKTRVAYFQLEISDTCYLMTRVALKLDPTRSEAIMALPLCAVTSSQGFHDPPN